MKSFFFLFFALVIFNFEAFSQPYFRIQADFSIKEKSGASSILTIGTIYYDSNVHTIVYDINFPEKEKIIISDSTITKVKNNKVVSVSKSPDIVTFSIYNLILSGNFLNYGLSKSNFKISKIEKENGTVISTWSPPKQFASKKGNMMLSQKDNILNGIISFSTDNKILSKQIFEEYQSIQNMKFPMKIVQFIYTNNVESTKITTFKNVVFNNLKNDEIYNFKLPTH